MDKRFRKRPARSGALVSLGELALLILILALWFLVLSGCGPFLYVSGFLVCAGLWLAACAVIEFRQ